MKDFNEDMDCLPERIAAFKEDPEKLRQANEFVDLLIQQAIKEAELKQKDIDGVRFGSFDADAGNIKRRLGRARGFMVRMFDALCNCTHTAAAAARSTRNPFAKR